MALFHWDSPSVFVRLRGDSPQLIEQLLMKLVFSEHAWKDYIYWQRTDKKILKRINELIKDIQKNKYQ